MPSVVAGIDDPCRRGRSVVPARRRHRPAAEGIVKAPIANLADFTALDPFFRIIEQGLGGLAGPGHFFDLLAEDITVDYVVTVPGYPRRVAVPPLLRAAAYGTMIVLDRCFDLAVHHDAAKGVVVLEYASDGHVVGTGRRYSNRYISRQRGPSVPLVGRSSAGILRAAAGTTGWPPLTEDPRPSDDLGPATGDRATVTAEPRRIFPYAAIAARPRRPHREVLGVISPIPKSPRRRARGLSTLTGLPYSVEPIPSIRPAITAAAAGSSPAMLAARRSGQQSAAPGP